jgi:hypothetical protein
MIGEMPAPPFLLRKKTREEHLTGSYCAGQQLASSHYRRKGNVLHNNPWLEIVWQLPIANLFARDRQFFHIPSEFSGD